MATDVWFWIAFNAVVFFFLALDLGVFHRKAHVVSLREAAVWSTVWIVLALSFNLFIYLASGSERALEFLTGYVIEKSLSVDNIFIFVMLFSLFSVPAAYQHRVLFWGILGALVMRGILIGAGAVLVKEFHWILYLFGAFLVITGLRMALERDRQIEIEKNLAVRLARRVLPITSGFHGPRFFIRDNGRLMATPLLLVLLAVETTDLIFAIDSIPAVFAVTNDPFIVYTSNVFAILGLRALYFLLAGVIEKFHLLKLGLSVVLIFVGMKMLLADVYAVPILVSLAVIATIVLASVAASLLWRRQPAATEHARSAPAAWPSDAELM